MKMASEGRLVPSVGSFKDFCRTCRNRCGYFVAPRCLFWSSKVIMTNSNASDVFPPKDSSFVNIVDIDVALGDR